jgi:hypothetical protein
MTKSPIKYDSAGVNQTFSLFSVCPPQTLLYTASQTRPSLIKTCPIVAPTASPYAPVATPRILVNYERMVRTVLAAGRA